MSGRTPKEIRQRREQKPKPKQRRVAPKKNCWLDRLNLSIGIASLVLVVIGWILGLRAGPTVSLGSPLDPNDVLTTPVEISNSGLIDLEDMRIQSFELTAFTNNAEFRNN